MLPESDRELLTAYVDGELSTRQRKAALRLLRRSEAARQLLRDLQADSAVLRRMPRPARVPDFTPSVLQAIAQRDLAPSAPHRPRFAVPAWVGAAAAAALVLLIGGGTYLLVDALTPDHTPVVRNKNDKQRPEGSADAKKSGTDSEAVVKKGPNREPEDDPDKAPTPPDAVVRGRDVPPEKPDMRPEPGDIATAPGIEAFRPQIAEVILPGVFRLRELTQTAVYEDLQKQLGRHDAFYVELLYRDGAPAFQKVQAALKASGVELIADGPVQERLKQKGARTNYLFYLDELAAADLARTLQRVCEEDARTEPKKAPGPSAFAGPDFNLIVCPMTPDHRKKLVSYLGVDPRQSAGKKSEKLALAVVHSPLPPRPHSPEIKRFLDQRRGDKDGVQMILVLRVKP
jgi:hypothetical protein